MQKRFMLSVINIFYLQHTTGRSRRLKADSDYVPPLLAKVNGNLEVRSKVIARTAPFWKNLIFSVQSITYIGFWMSIGRFLSYFEWVLKFQKKRNINASESMKFGRLFVSLQTALLWVKQLQALFVIPVPKEREQAWPSISVKPTVHEVLLFCLSGLWI